MIVSNTAWTLAGAGAEASLVIQNVGKTQIGYVFAASLPADTAYDASPDAVFRLNAQSDAVTIQDLDTYSKNVYVRSYGPTSGMLAVETNS
jgi:hypothetical protein